MTTKPTADQYIEAAMLLYEKPNGVIQIVADERDSSIEITEDGLGAYVDARIWIPLADTLPEGMTRAKLKHLPSPKERCDPKCKGWFVDPEKLAPVRCDDCCSGLPVVIYDEDIAELPEAQAEVARVTEMVHKEEHGTCYGLFAEWCPLCLKEISWLRSAR